MCSGPGALHCIRSWRISHSWEYPGYGGVLLVLFVDDPSNYSSWLMVWNFFLFSIICGIILPID
jgi:hypothetical protein